jgi:coatomer protein complex subunit gamma
VVTHQPRKCCQLITKLLHILTQGESFSSGEATEVFFGVTKLFQSKDVSVLQSYDCLFSCPFLSDAV